MSVCNADVVKLIAKYLNVSAGPICLNTDRVLTTILDKENVEGFASIILRITAKSGANLSQEQILLCYQWLEHIAMYADQAAGNPALAKNFLLDINKALQKKSYLAGHFLTVSDIAAYYALYPLLERLNHYEKESLLHVCRWSKHIQSQPKVLIGLPPLPLGTLTLSVLAPAVH